MSQAQTLPKIGESLEGGKFAGLLSDKDGQPYALVLLPDQGSDLNWKAAQAWAEGLKASLPNRVEAAMLFRHLRAELRQDYHWTDEESETSASFAWICDFDYGGQYYYHEHDEFRAVAVRRLPLGSFDPLNSAQQRAAEDVAKLRASAMALVEACDAAVLV